MNAAQADILNNTLCSVERRIDALVQVRDSPVRLLVSHNTVVMSRDGSMVLDKTKDGLHYHMTVVRAGSLSTNGVYFVRESAERVAEVWNDSYRAAGGTEASAEAVVVNHREALGMAIAHLTGFAGEIRGMLAAAVR